MNNTNLKIRLLEIDAEIKKANDEKTTAFIMMIISIFLLWPLLIIGGIWYSSANKKIASLENEKKRISIIMSELNKSNQEDT